MSSILSLWPKGQILKMLHAAGAVAAGSAKAAVISPEAASQFYRWSHSDAIGTMTWLRRHAPLRLNPQTVFPGVRSVICAAFPYSPPRGYGHRYIADYALGTDYHYALRRRLQPIADEIFIRYGALSRICIDSAPLPERYWATMCGMGRPGRSGQFIVPGVGAGVFLATILTTLDLPADSPLSDFDPCEGCSACIDACPGAAIKPDGTLDCRRCLSYLTIEHRGPWPAVAPPPRGRFFGCDVCRRVCPHSCSGVAEPLPEFLPRPDLQDITQETLCALTPSAWRRLSHPVAPSVLSRLRFSQLSERPKP